ncbi:MAG: cell division protein FtsL [Oleiphilaceae bacterium]|jgi:cell division protein FtsL
MINFLNMFVRSDGREFVVNRPGRSATVLLHSVADFIQALSVMLAQVSIKGLVVTSMLLSLVLMSALGVVYSSHLSRQLFAEQAVLLERSDQVQLEWAQLLLEQSAWSSPNRIERIAVDQLEMAAPETENIKLIY